MRVEQQPLVLQVVPPRSASDRDIVALETVMQGLALDDRHPIALEIARTAQGRQFLLRATSEASLEHLAAQIQARYPQASIHPLSEDPLTLKPGETIAAVELQPGAASYLPLRSWRERELPVAGTDPLLGVLAAVSHLPTNTRAVAQLALVPLPPTWSQVHRRRAVEHPLEPERQRQRRGVTTSGSSAPSTAGIMAMGILVAVLLLWYRFARRVPPWILRAGTLLLHGKDPQLSSSQVVLLVASLVGIAMAILLVLLMINWLLSRLRQTSIYDMRLVAEKTGRSAYRARLRLFVIVAGTATVGKRAGHVPVEPVPVRALSVVVRPQPMSPTRIKGISGQWWQTRRQKHEQGRPAKEVLDRLTAAYRQYHTASGSYFVPYRLSARKAQRLLLQRTGLARVFTGWERDLRRSDHILSVADIAVLWHLPQSSDLPDLSLLERGRARRALAPSELTLGTGWKIGTSHHAGHCVPVFLPQECLRHNLLAVASTGKGKSTLFQHLAQAVWAMRSTTGDAGGPGLAFIEPHGDVIHALCGLLPASQRDSVVLIDLANTDYPVGINPLDMVGRDRDKAVDTLITIAEHLWASSYGSRTENVLEYALKTLADANELLIESDPYQGPDRQYTLLDVVPLLRAASFRHAVLEQVRDELLIDWWQHYYEPLDAHQQREVTSSVITKLSKFASSRVARRILGQPRSTIDLRAVIRAGQYLLVSTASGVVGADLSELVGIVLLGLFEAALAEQAVLPPDQRRRYLVLIDEFQVYRGANYQSMLAELRKYGGSFALATQSLAYLDRLDRTLRATVLANIDHLFAFHMAGEDARLLHELDGIAEEEVTNLDDFQSYVKLSLDGHRLPIFSLDLDAPPRPDQDVAQLVRLRSQERDGRPTGVADDLIRQTLARQRSAVPTKQRALPTRREEDTVRGDDYTEADSARRRKKRGGSSRRQAETQATPPHQHLMYPEEEEGASADGREDEGGGAPND
jgi:hypothetical protein